MPAVAPTALVQKTRYGNSETTFGLKGRIVMTILLFLPLALFIPAITIGFGLLGCGIWIFVVLPWGLRDIWRTSHKPGLRSVAAVNAPVAAAADSTRFGVEQPRR